MSKKLSEGIKGESLNLLFGSILNKDDDEEKEKVKSNILKLLNEKYGIKEEDFISSEFEIVPAYKSKDVGLDKSLVGAYGQDDRVCVYTSLQAILDVDHPTYTTIALFVDKEEIGSEGNTSAQSITFLRSLIKKLDPSVDVDEVMLQSKVLSADVDAAITPNYTEVFELKNASALGKGAYGQPVYKKHLIQAFRPVDLHLV